MSPSFSLDPKIATDTLPLTNLAFSELRLLNDARYPWLVLVPAEGRRCGDHRFTADERTVLVEEIATVAAVLKAVTGCDKLNVAALGNTSASSMST